MQILDFSLAVNQSRPIEAAGNYIYYYAGAAGGADNTIVIRADTGGSTIRLQPGQAYRLPRGSKPALRWYVQNYANAATITGVVVIGDGELTDNRITGEVSVIDGGRALTMNGQAFVANMAWGAPSVGNYSAVQLHNPIGNTKWAAVSRVIVASTGASAIALRPTLAGILTVSTPPQPKKVDTGTTNTTMESRIEQPATTPGGNVLGYVWCNANDPFTFEFKEPVILKPGQGLVAVTGAVNSTIVANFDFYEFTP